MLDKTNRGRISFYTLDHGRHPDGIMLDGWRHPLIFEKTGHGLRIRSAGKDGLPDTKDDLIQDVPPKTSRST